MDPSRPIFNAGEFVSHAPWLQRWLWCWNRRSRREQPRMGVMDQARFGRISRGAALHIWRFLSVAAVQPRCRVLDRMAMGSPGNERRADNVAAPPHEPLFVD